VSNARKPKKAPSPVITPMIGALLRLPHEVVVAQMLSALNANGFDLTLTELGVFLYPGPDGRRPIDLARQCNATRQTMNYVLTSLEQRGYIERRAESGSTTRLVRMTTRGWELVALIRGTLSEIEKDWSRHLGAPRFKVLRETLRDLAQWLGKLE
jgi:DNA-binding MarR family transcriptional regulator